MNEKLTICHIFRSYKYTVLTKSIIHYWDPTELIMDGALAILLFFGAAVLRIVEGT